MLKQIFKIFIFSIFLSCNHTFGQFDNKNYNVQILFNVEDKMFPESWYESEINAEPLSLDSAECERSKQLILNAVKKYPASIINANLEKVYVLKRIKFYGVDYGGTYYLDSKTVYVTNSGIENGYTDEFVEQSFHHEFSSILMQAYSFDDTNWKSKNKPGVEYGSGGVNAIIEGNSSLDFDSNYNKNGFLSAYGMSDVENDFNTFAENLFLPSKDFWLICNKYSRIKAKVKIMITFYLSIDEQFSEEYFKNQERLIKDSIDNK